MLKHKFLGVITARGGSKRFSRKNITYVNNYPLIYWSIKYAKESKLLNKFIVSTEDKQIVNTAKFYGADVLQRPPELANDLVSQIDVLKHALISLPEFTDVVLLQPTNPIRIENIIDKCIEKFVSSKSNSLATGYICKNYGWTDKTIDPLGPSQLKKGWFYNDGCVEIHNRDVILSGKPYGKNRIEFIVPKYYSYDIDDKYDLIATESIMQYLEM